MAQQCPSERDIRNLETSASSMTLDGVEKELRYIDIARARRCQPLMSDAEKELARAEIRRRNAAAHAPAQAAPASENGTVYINGRPCMRNGSFVYCN